MDKTILADYIPVGLILIVAAALGVGQILLSAWVGPKRWSAVKREPFECGIAPIGPATIQVSFKFCLVALLFLIFDVETVFIWLWAKAFAGAVRFAPESAGGLSFQMFAFWEMMIFLGILLVGYLYAWRKGALDWS